MTTEIDAEGLLPCPFCGDAEPVTTGIYGKDQWWIGCVECSAKTAVFNVESRAIAAWNRRATRTSEAEPVAVTMTIDREALRKRIENDPDEGEIGAGFEMFTPEAEVALERMAFAALPRWAQDELTALRAAATLPTPASDDQVEALNLAAAALAPFASAVFNDNGDLTIDASAPTSKDLAAAYFALRKVRAALLAAMGSTKPAPRLDATVRSGEEG